MEAQVQRRRRRRRRTLTRTTGINVIIVCVSVCRHFQVTALSVMHTHTHTQPSKCMYIHCIYQFAYTQTNTLTHTLCAALSLFCLSRMRAHTACCVMLPQHYLTVCMQAGTPYIRRTSSRSTHAHIHSKTDAYTHRRTDEPTCTQTLATFPKTSGLQLSMFLVCGKSVAHVCSCMCCEPKLLCDMLAR